MTFAIRRILGACFDGFLAGGCTFLSGFFIMCFLVPPFTRTAPPTPLRDWLLASAWLLSAIAVAILMGVWRYRVTLPDVERRCQKCDYILRGLTAPRCPECGTPFDLKLKSDSGDQP